MRSYRSYPGGMGGMRIGPGFVTPVIKYLLIANGIIFLIQNLSSLNITGTFGLTPALFFREFPNYFFQPVTYMFLHAGLFHILFNMFALWMFGTEIEQAWGARSFSIFYLICGLGGAFFSLVFTPGLQAPIIGASGAIFGILTAYWLMFPNRSLLLFFIFPMKVKFAIPLLFVLTFVAGGAQVAHLAHLGGILVGLAYLKLDWRIYRPLEWWRNFKYKRKTAKQQKRRMEAEEVMSRVDAILDKINAVGIENITEEEQKFLTNASEILSKGENKKREGNKA